MGYYETGDVVTLYHDKRDNTFHYFQNYKIPKMAKNYKSCGIKLENDFEDLKEAFFAVSLYASGTIVEIIHSTVPLPIN